MVLLLAGCSAPVVYQNNIVIPPTAVPVQTSTEVNVLRFIMGPASVCWLAEKGFEGQGEVTGGVLSASCYADGLRHMDCSKGGSRVKVLNNQQLKLMS